MNNLFYYLHIRARLRNYKPVEFFDEHVRDWERFQRDPAWFDAEDFIRF